MRTRVRGAGAMGCLRGAHRARVRAGGDADHDRAPECGVLRDSIVEMRGIAGAETPVIDAAYALLDLKARLAGVAPPV